MNFTHKTQQKTLTLLTLIEKCPNICESIKFLAKDIGESLKDTKEMSTGHTHSSSSHNFKDSELSQHSPVEIIPFELSPVKDLNQLIRIEDNELYCDEED